MSEINCFVSDLGGASLSESDVISIWGTNSNGQVDERQRSPEIMKTSSRWKKAKEELEKGKVEFCQGRLSWNGSDYKLEGTPGITMEGVTLYPGNYVFYYLPESGLILSGLLLDPPAEAEAKYLQILADANGFDLSSLPLNRSGKLADGQKTNNWTSAAAYTAVMAGATGFMFYVNKLFLAGLGVLVTLVSLVKLIKQHLDSSNAGTTSLTSIVTASYTNPTSYMAGTKSFEAPREALNALISNRPHVLHFATHSKRLVNIEPVSGKPAVYAKGNAIPVDAASA